MSSKHYRNRIDKWLVVVAALAAVMAMAGPARAGMQIGGDLRMETSWGFYDSNYSAYNQGVDKSYGSVAFWDTVDSLLEFRWTSADKKYMAYTMLGVEGNGGDGTFTRQAYFQYNADGWVIRFGQAPTIFDRYWSNQLLNQALGLDGYGKIHFERVEQVRLMIGDKYRFLFSAESGYKGNVWTGGRSYRWLPALGASAELTFGPIQLNPWVRYELVQWEDGATTDDYSSIDLGLGITGEFGLIGFTVAGGYGLNSAMANPILSGDPLVLANKVEDNVTQLSLWGELRIGGLSLGGGVAGANRADWRETPTAYAGFVSYKIPFGPMEFIPEVAYFNNGKDGDGVEQGSYVLAGVSMHLAF